MIARDVMDSNIVTVHEKATLEEIFDLARVHRTADFVVVDSNLNYCGMLFESVLLNKLHDETKKKPSSTFNDFQEVLKGEFRKAPIREFMSTTLPAFEPQETVERMAEKMLFERTSKMAVVEHGTKVIGVVSLSRILSSLMDRLLRQKDVRQAPPPPKIDEAQNKRFFPRVPFCAPVAYRLVEGDSGEVPVGKIAQTLNVSAGGLLILTKEKLPLAKSLHVALDLYQNDQPLRMVCRIVRCLPSKQEGSFEVGLMFVAMGIQERCRLEEHLKKQSSKTAS